MRTGFTLIEMSVVLVIIGIIAAGSLTIGQSLINRTQYQSTDEQLDAIRDALIFFYRNQNRLPCPARADVTLGANNFGQEIIWDGSGDSCANDTSVPSGTTRTQTTSSSGIWVRSGALPTRTLGLPDAMMADQFDNRFTYAVIEDLTDDTSFEAADTAIIINNGSGSDIETEAAFVVISHGEDTKGGYRYRSGTQIACGGFGIDRENCDGDTTYTDTFYNDNAQSSDFYDDRIAWMDKSNIMSQGRGLAIRVQSRRWAGKTSSTHTGNIGGVMVANSICNSEFAGSRMLREDDLPFLSSQDFATMVGVINSSGSGSNGSPWYLYRSSFSYDGSLGNSITCEGFETSSGSESGGVIHGSSSSNILTPSTTTCNTSHPIACVYE